MKIRRIDHKNVKWPVRGYDVKTPNPIFYNDTLFLIIPVFIAGATLLSILLWWSK